MSSGNGVTKAFNSSLFSYKTTATTANRMEAIQNDRPPLAKRRYSEFLQRIKTSYKLKSLLAVKPVEAFIAERENRKEGQSLAEKLGLIDLLGYGVGCTVGAGIYSLVGIGAGIAGQYSQNCVNTCLAHVLFLVGRSRNCNIICCWSYILHIHSTGLF